MSFSRILRTKPIYCLKLNNHCKQNLSFSLKVKYFHSLNSVTNIKRPIVRTITTNTTNILYRCISTVRADTTIDFKPTINETNDQIIDLSMSGIDPSLVESISNLDVSKLPITELGLASNWMPTGWILHLLELLNGTLPWYATIAVATLIFRTAMFPIVIKAQRNAMKMNQILPQLQELQAKATNARLSGNQLEFARYTMEVQKLFKDNGINPVKNFAVPMAQAPVFLSFFLVLRRLARLPAESLKTGGILWFVDLTVPDPYHILPIITSISLWGALELGVESGVNAQTSHFVKLFIRAIPVITLFCIWNFESAILMYWFSTNTISLLQVMLLKQKTIRQKLNLPIPIKHPPTPEQKKGFYQSI